jgi:hypothetical protein
VLFTVLRAIELFSRNIGKQGEQALGAPAINNLENFHGRPTALTATPLVAPPAGPLLKTGTTPPFAFVSIRAPFERLHLGIPSRLVAFPWIVARKRQKRTT